MLLCGKMYHYYQLSFTLRRGCLNPAIGFAFQFYAAIEKGNVLLFLPYCLPLLVGPILGGFAAVRFFKNFYGPLKEGLALQRMQMSQINE
jgi:hypothetical protein